MSDVTRYPQWGPWRAAKYRREGDASPHGPGAVQWLQSDTRVVGRYPVSVEKILEADEPLRLIYAVIGGLPVRHYRAEVTLTPTDGGTHIRWAATMDSTFRGRMVWKGLLAFYPKMLDGLVAASERQHASE